MLSGPVEFASSLQDQPSVHPWPPESHHSLTEREREPRIDIRFGSGGKESGRGREEEETEGRHEARTGCPYPGLYAVCMAV